jgi:hypothetical protein
MCSTAAPDAVVEDHQFWIQKCAQVGDRSPDGAADVGHHAGGAGDAGRRQASQQPQRCRFVVRGLCGFRNQRTDV